MARTFEYAILTAIPDSRRGERVNIGLVVFKPNGVDVRLQAGLFKLRALTGQTMESRIQAVRSIYEGLFSAQQKPEEMLRRFKSAEPLLVPTDLGWFRAENDEQYEQRIEEKLTALVTVPKQERAERGSRIETEINRQMLKAKILAGPNESIKHGKVVKNYVVDDSEGLVADYALKNGKLHIANTLDLRRVTADQKDAALKSIVLDRAKKKNRRGTVCIGIYAVHRDMREHFRRELALFEEYAVDGLFNWGDREQKRKLSHHFQDAMGLPGGSIFR